MHIDEWLDKMEENPPEDENLKKVFEYLDFRRMSAAYQGVKFYLRPMIKVFCIYNNIKYKIIGASRLGDVWLTTNFDADHGYELRVDIDDCSEFSWCYDGKKAMEVYQHIKKDIMKNHDDFINGGPSQVIDWSDYLEEDDD